LDVVMLINILAHPIQVYIIGGDGTQKGAYEIFKVMIAGMSYS
jgi:hypothetical protein